MGLREGCYAATVLSEAYRRDVPRLDSKSPFQLQLGVRSVRTVGFAIGAPGIVSIPKCPTQICPTQMSNPKVAKLRLLSPQNINMRLHVCVCVCVWAGGRYGSLCLLECAGWIEEIFHHSIHILHKQLPRCRVLRRTRVPPHTVCFIFERHGPKRPRGFINLSPKSRPGSNSNLEVQPCASPVVLVYSVLIVLVIATLI